MFSFVLRVRCFRLSCILLSGVGFSFLTYADSGLKDLLHSFPSSGDSDGTQVIVEEEQPNSSAADRYIKLVRQALANQAVGNTTNDLTGEVPITRRYQGQEGILMPTAAPQKVEFKSSESGLENFDGGTIPGCNESIIVKRVQRPSTANNKVWLDMLYVYEDTVSADADFAKMYGEDIKIRRISRDAGNDAFRSYRADGAKCLPFRLRLIGDDRYRLYGMAALKKW